MPPRKTQLILAEGILEKHFTIKDLDINSNSKYTEAIQPLGRKRLFCGVKENR